MPAPTWTVCRLTRVLRWSDHSDVWLIPGDSLSEPRFEGGNCLVQLLGEWYAVPLRSWANLTPVPPVTPQRSAP